MATKLMAIRRPDVCAGCSEPLPPHTRAWWDSGESTVTCVECQPSTATATSTETSASTKTSTTIMGTARREPTPLPPPQPINIGTGGASAQREYEPRAARHQQRTQDAAFGTGVLGEVSARPDNEPGHLTAWANGAAGERFLAAHLDRELAGMATVLHDRSVPTTNGNIEHLVVASSGIWIIDAKNYSGKVDLRNAGTSAQPDMALYVNNRNQTQLAEKMDWQFNAVRRVLDTVGFGVIPIYCCVCFTNAEWPMYAKPFEIGKVWVGWGDALTATITRDTYMGADAMATLSHHLNAQLPATAIR